jgi:hypothetical protein
MDIQMEYVLSSRLSIMFNKGTVTIILETNGQGQSIIQLDKWHNENLQPIDFLSRGRKELSPMY